MNDSDDFWFEPIQGIYMRSSHGEWIDINTDALRNPPNPSFWKKLKELFSALIGHLNND